MRAGAVRTLTRIREPAEKILAAVKTAAEDRHPGVRHAAFDALVSMKADAVSIGAAAATVLDDLAKAGESVAFSNTCKVVVRLGPDAKEAVPELNMAMEEPALREAAQKALTEIDAGDGPSLDLDI